MNKVITINLGGNAYQLEEGGYDVLRTYLETATARLAGNPDRDEILSDIERAIADRFRALLASHKTVVEAKEVAAVITDMGPIEADSSEAREPSEGAASGASGAGGEARASGHSGPPRRLYRIEDDSAMLCGVCNGIAAYLNIDPTFVRIAFVALTIFWGTGVMVYIVLAIVIPEARSPEEKSAASGIPSTAQEFIHRAKEGYYKAMKNFPDRKARREWSREFRRDVRANAYKWQRDWHSYWGKRAPVHPGMGFALPFLSLLNAVVMIVLICALVSVLATGGVFGRHFPGGLPGWEAVVVLLVVYSVLVGPLKLARRGCYRGMGQPGWSWPFVFLLDAVVWLGVVAVLLCLMVHYFPEVRDALHSIPSVVHQAVDDIRTWWKQK